MTFLKTLMLLIMIPLIGYGVSIWVVKDYNNIVHDALGKDVSIHELCQPNVLSEINDSEQMIALVLLPFLHVHY